MTPQELSRYLKGPLQPRGYVSFLSALVHHGVLIDSLAVIQVASPDLSGRGAALRPGPVEFVLLCRDLYFGWRSEPFEGDWLPVALPEKALLDWLYLCEERGMDPRLEEMEWEVFDPGRLDHMARRTGLDYRARLPDPRALEASCHDQARRRLESLRALEGGAERG